MGVGALAVTARRARTGPRFAERLATLLATLVVVLLAAIPRRAQAHELHTTYTVITIDGGRGSATISIRTFVDDFSAAVARAAGKRAPRDSSVTAEAAAAYVRERLVLEGITLVPCGLRRAGDVYLLCFRAALPAGAALRARNQLLTERHDDQVNIVQLHDGGRQRTQLFTRHTATLVLADR